MTHNIFIDGAAGTTGLEIAERLAGRSEFALISLDEAQRKDAGARRDALNAADVAILCLPDEAAREAVAMIDPPSGTSIIDASSAHRTAAGWCYGFPELVGRERVANARRISNPGCYPTGFLALIAPLVKAQLLPTDWPYTVHAVSGFSGGGKGMIERFEILAPPPAYRTYGLGMGHKHLAEMQAHAGLTYPPVFSPAVIDAFRGMIVEVPLQLSAIEGAGDPAALLETLEEFYHGSDIVHVHPDFDLPAELLVNPDARPRDDMTLFVFAAQDRSQLRLVAVLDNLGKGASGAAVQNLNLLCDLPETAGLHLPKK